VNPLLAAHFANHANTLKRFPSICAMLERNGQFPREGDALASPELARTLEVIATEGPRAFYTGEIAEKLSAYILANGGHITKEDLESYVPYICEPLRIGYRGHEILTPPLGSGGATTLQILKILEGFDVPKMKRESAELIHLFAEAAKLAWRDRVQYFADPKTVPVDTELFLSDCHAEEFRKVIRTGRGTASPAGSGGPAFRQAQGGEHGRTASTECTTHISVIDEQRNLVSMTFTHGMLFGACVAVPELGVILGDGMFRFDPRPGRANSAAPGKRTLHNMSPLMIFRNGKPVITCGTPGGRKILSAMTWLTMNLLDFGMGPAEALAFPRCHCENRGPLSIENPTKRPVDGAPGAAPWRNAEALRKGLEALGHKVQFEAKLGSNAHAILLDPKRGGLRSGVDPRGLGAALGY
jgi:gamma-glutamyltranspeptidase/glutathione hydrolase